MDDSIHLPDKWQFIELFDANKSERKRAEFKVPPHGGTVASSPMVQPRKRRNLGYYKKTDLNPDECRRW